MTRGSTSPDGLRGPPSGAMLSDQASLLTEAALPTRFGDFRIAAFQVHGDPAEAIALIHGDLTGGPTPLVRLHSECLTGEALGSLRCDCGDQLTAALARIAEVGCGVLVYLRQEGRGIGLVNKLRAYALQDGGLDTVDANLALGLPVDAREYGSAAAVLRALGVQRVRLLTNNPAKRRALEQAGIEVVERVAAEVPPNATNANYLLTKAARMGHVLSWGESPAPSGGLEGALNGAAHQAGIGDD
jgi:GTP cyclohydrolase II